MKLTRTFAELIRQKLTIGNSQSILLHAIPGKLASRMALTDLDAIKSATSFQFLQLLTRQKTFNCKITINFFARTPDEQNKLTKIGKRLSSIKFDYDDHIKEHGVETFGFGFPILVHPHPNDATKVLAAPVFIFPLDIKQSYDKPLEWIISRSSDSEIRVNDVLASFLENEEHIKMPNIPEEVLEEGIMDEQNIIDFCKELVSKFQDEGAIYSVLPIFDQLPEKLKAKEAGASSRILWNGVFGIYKSQKQNLIREVDALLADFDNLTAERDEIPEWENAHSPMATDPSQNGVLRSLNAHRNLVIQGPPGTGKSQTLTAIVSGALANKKKVLVVCEKRTALDVLKNNLERLIPETKNSIALIEDIIRDRSTIVELVRNRTALYLAGQHHLQGIIKEDIARFEEKAQHTDRQYNALKEPIWQNLRWAAMVAKWNQPLKSIEEKYRLYEFQKIYEADDTSDESYSVLRHSIGDGVRLFVKIAGRYNYFQSTIRLPETLPKHFVSEYVNTAIRDSKKVQSLLVAIKAIKSRLEEAENKKTNTAIDQLATKLKRLGALTAFAKERKADLYEVTFVAKILALFSKKWKQVLADSAEAIVLREDCGKIWAQLFDTPLAAEDPMRQAAEVEGRRTAIANELYERLLNCAIEEVNVDEPDPEEIHRIAAALSELQNSVHEYVHYNKAALNNVRALEDEATVIEARLAELLKYETEIRDYISWKVFLGSINDLGRSWIDALIELRPDSWTDIVEQSWLYYKLLEHDREDKFPTDDSSLRVLKELGIKIQKHQEELIKHNLDAWFASGHARIKQLGLQINQLYNLRGAKGSTRNSLRKIIHADLVAFTDLFPVLMLNPSTCSSLLPLQRDLFDIIIFDEASQLRIEDTFTALLRGKQVIVSGDSQQMPPSNYFGSTIQLDDQANDEEVEEAADASEQLIEDASRGMAARESLLDFAIDAGYTQTYLDMHYRSKHPDLIAFSNACFYNSRLVPMPEKSNEKPIAYLHVNGLYENNRNQREAEEIIRLLREEISEVYSVGIATFNLNQRNLILTLIGEERVNDRAFHAKMSMFEKNGFFVKNLENIQGDEKDIILMSTTFGVKSDGKFLMNFGPISGANGHRLFNVIITRAKIKMYVVTSIPEGRIPEYRNRLEANRKIDGRTAFMAYLDYAKAVSNGDEAEQQSILDLIRTRLSAGVTRLPGASFELTESPFEEQVYSWLVEAIGPERIRLQYKCGGFRIDMVVLGADEHAGKKLAIECDGAAYHSDQLTWHHDIYRQEQLEQEGFVFYRIWSTNWWRKPEKEFEQLLEAISNLK